MATNLTCRLTSRSLLRVRGTEAHTFLQGLFTNDVMQLTPGGSQWGCFLFFTGRVFCEAHLYHCRREQEGQSAILIDTHESMKDPLLDHLAEMKMRKKVVIEDVSSQLAVVANVNNTVEPREANALLREVRSAEDFLDARSFALIQGVSGGSGGEGERVPHAQLYRTVLPVEWSPSRHDVEPIDAYDRLLYQNGVGEGPHVFRHNKTLPFEGNLDFLEGVSFHKGCYIGQELTHRTHVMLVTRKRTVPLRFDPSVSAGVPPQVGDPLYLNEKDRVGEVVAVSGEVGLGLLRLRYVDKETHTLPSLTTQREGIHIPTTMSLPSWWPPKAIKKMLKNN